ncbi:MAG: hypothetical protein M1812_000362 [Candelaria pacifica]|nr:MAG: hypothetical protein M1812_000362 [Candelaria pacifica]
MGDSSAASAVQERSAIAGTEKISITVCGDGGCGGFTLYQKAIGDYVASLTLGLVGLDRQIFDNASSGQKSMDAGVGLFPVYCSSVSINSPLNRYDPTIEDSYSVNRTIDGTTYYLSLTDTAGQEEYRGLWAASNLKSDAFLLVYDITNAESLPALDHFMQMIDMEAESRLDEDKPLPVKMVAGNKCDLQGSRQLKSVQGLEWARSRGCAFMETSAREMVNIEETFAVIVRRVVEQRRLHANRGAYALADQNSRSQALPASNEKYSLSGSADSMSKMKRKGFWKKLKCW